MAEEPIGLGVVGVGTLALRVLPHFAPHLTQPDVTGRVRVTALCDTQLQRAEQAARHFQVPRAYARLEDLLADPTVDAVSIASPIGLHHEQGRAALQAGKHVHFNKTMTTTVAEADELIALAARHDLRIVASPGEVLHPRTTRTRELIREGAIGEPTWVIGGGTAWQHHERDEGRLHPTAGPPIDPTWYFRRPGGGPMYDITVYALHQMTSVLGPVQRVTALSGVRIAEREFLGRPIPIDADDNTLLLLDFGGSLFAVAYGAAAGRDNQSMGAARYLGTQGMIEGSLLNGAPFAFAGSDRIGDVTDWQALQGALPDVVGGHRELLEPHVFQDIMTLVDWIATGVASPASAEHARHVIDIIESGYRSAQTGSAQALSTTFELPEA